jgi:putative heme-binding domain-containing protein
MLRESGNLRKNHSEMKFYYLLFILLPAGSAWAGTPPGLVLSLDAAAQPALRQAAALPPLGNGTPADRWVDGSGASAALQADRAAMPVYHANGQAAFLRFDGKNDYLLFAGPRRLVPEVTVFILAAPRGNPGDFSALISMSEAGRNDFTSGLNLDFGQAATPELSVLNLETAGAPGVFDFLQPGRNLAADLPFAGWHVFTVRSKIGAQGNEVFLDGLRLGDRLRMESNIGMDVIALGARLCSLDPAQPPFANGFFHGDLAAVQVFDRALTDQEQTAVERDLFARTAALNALASGASGHALETLTDAPPLQMLVPGFSVRELPLKLTNRNNLRYRHDGKLVSLGYDGTIHLLTDTDGDGLEDKADVFWDKETMRGPIGIALLTKDDPRGEGVFVASKGKISLILDKDRDGRADEEVIVATGWKEISQSVDAVGMAVDPEDGSLYFGLGCANYANGYLIDPATGKAGYDLKSERGTIQRVSADFKTRETICTGVRFTCALAFNREGDLFATEQEGATWLPNGNAFDELLHIERGRHYGFPPRHPQHLPDVVDWPAVMEYGPQHQSTVGMVFNEGVNGGPAFGPGFWAGDALVCGEARGKLYRTKLAKTPHGYVAQNHLIACLGLLTVDCCVSPQGDLVVACHSGPPDWGTGPKGEGRIFKVSYTGKTAPQPVWAWAQAPDEFRIGFDRELHPADWAGAAVKARIEAGRYVSAGDRYEVIRPGYQMVRDQMAAPRRTVEVQALSLASDQRTLVIKIPRQTEAVGYAVTLPVPETWRNSTGIPQHAELDLLVTLNGVEATQGKEPRVILPGAAPLAAIALLKSSSTADWLARQAPTANDVHLVGAVDHRDIFQPAVQQGATLDWQPSKLTGSFITSWWTGDEAQIGPKDLPGWISGFGGPVGGRASGFSGKEGFFAVSGKDRFPLPLKNHYVSWADDPSGSNIPSAPGEALPGDWLAGRAVFFSAEAACATCHQVRGQGIAVGPDLTNLISRDRASVLADILHPSAAINPDHPASTVKLKGGQSLTGIVRGTEGDMVKVALQAGVVQTLAKADISGIEQLRTSLMPEGYAERLSKAQQDDLLKFLLTNPLDPAPPAKPGAPAPRSWASIPETLQAAINAPATNSGQPLRLLLCAGPKDHGPGEHDYPLWLERWSKLLPMAPGVTVDTSMTFPATDQLAAADVAIFFSRNPGWNPAAAARLDAFTQRGGGLVYLHWAVEGGTDVLLLAERIGLATQGGVTTKYRHGPVRLDFVSREHPITRGFPDNIDFDDETYWNLQGDPSRLTPLANGIEEEAPRPQLWVRDQHQGRVCVCIPGHNTWTFDDPLYRLLVLRAISWTGRQDDAERLSPLSTVGARMVP